MMLLNALVLSRGFELKSSRFGPIFAAVLIASFICIAAVSGDQIAIAQPQAPESLFADCSLADDARIRSARAAKAKGNNELAIHEYVASIHDDPCNAEFAIEELVDVFLSVAKVDRTDGRYVDESVQVMRCYQALQRLKQADATLKPLTEPARVKLFQMIDRVRDIGRTFATSHIDAARKSQQQAKGRWDDDEDKQAEALHFVNLAWSYYPTHTDEAMVKSMYEIWAAMKGELASWHYSRVMEQDRLQLGRTIEDR